MSDYPALPAAILSILPGIACSPSREGVSAASASVWFRVADSIRKRAVPTFRGSESAASRAGSSARPRPQAAPRRRSREAAYSQQRRWGALAFRRDAFCQSLGTSIFSPKELSIGSSLQAS